MARIALALALFSLALPARADHTAQDTERILQRVERDITLGHATAAQRRLKAALARPPQAPELLLRYAELTVPMLEPLTRRTLAMRVAHARTLLTLLNARPPTSGDDSLIQHLTLHAAWATALLGNYDDSIRLLREAGRLQDPATCRCAQLIAAAAVYGEHLDVAVQALALGRAYVPQDMRLMSALGRVHLARGDADAAIAVLSERFAIAPQDLNARRDLAYALTASGRATDALALLNSERAACTHDRGCALEAARIALESERIDDALHYTSARLAAAPDDPDALFIRADAFTQSGAFDQARAVWTRILETHPGSLRAQQALTQLPTSSNAQRP